MTPSTRSQAALALVFALLMSGCASSYREFYRSANNFDAERISVSRQSPAPAIPIVERSRPGNAEEILDAYAKRGYVMIGNSMFNSGRSEQEDSAIQQAKDVKADLVLILNPNYTGSITSVVPITRQTSNTTYSNATATAYGRGGPVTAYGSGSSTTYGSATSYVPITTHRADYGAVYFIKRKIILGAFYVDLNEGERQELQTNRGAVVRVIVDGSPAFNADVLVGDVFTAIDGMQVSNSEALGGFLEERNGKAVNFSLLRRGQKIEKTIQLNPK